jgi:hypothetical protein
LTEAGAALADAEKRAEDVVQFASLLMVALGYAHYRCQELEEELAKVQAKNQQLETELSVDRRIVPEISFCGVCDRATRVWDGKKYSCLSCDR